MAVLEARNISIAFGGFYAVKNVNFTLQEGAVQAVIGPNGAGKTTLFNLLTKFLRPTKGQIFHEGTDVTVMTPAAIARRGVVRSFQISAVFQALTVRENIELALLRRSGLQWRLLGHARRNKALVERTNEILEQFGFAKEADMATSRLSYGRKRVLELATTVAADPEVLLLDEPMAGLGREDIDRVTDLIQQIARGRSVLLVEHNMQVVSRLADRITVMVRGQVLAEGSYAEVSTRPDVIAAYTGGGH
ncbi:ABC transporter ATP-binding protein [Falsochrobactrum sp. TDYN1]|uniref:ABC transporter ATP-binding protein n=1 Tax=Falsochrobactrum tianjinense TaxID=2706015 RepID=A0A949US96_9HYPH|nr:ABC transporter ATP-binding protein [Falsochrobactrum sp. TDYN1]MBV2142124.1 ABC transporter ATP-binding protein [Falsochrobactrum sp. TDYN1]